jgi:hypothetical protein
MKAEEKGVRLRAGSFLDSNIELQDNYCNQVLTYEKLCKLNKLVTDATNEMIRQVAFKEETIYEAMLIEDYMNSEVSVEKGAPKMIYSAHFPARNMDRRWDRLVGWLQYTWFVRMRPIALKMLAVATLLCTLIVIACELTFYFAPNQNYLSSVFAEYASRANVKSFFMANLVCLVPLGYICTTANFGMFNFKFFSLYQLHKH